MSACWAVPLWFTVCDPGEPVPSLPEAAWGLAAGFDMFDSVIEMAETARTFGVQLTSLEGFVRR